MKTTGPESFIHSKTSRASAFTFVELLAVVAVVAVIILLQLPVLAGGKQQSKIGVCASNLRQIAESCQIYASENNNRLPTPGPLDSANWAWDLPFSSAAALLRSGASKSLFYCPGTAPRFTEKENWQDVSAAGRNLWDFGDNAWPPQNSTGGLHITGYSLTFAGSLSNLIPTNQNSTMLPETLKGASVMPAPAASDRVLLADATISAGSSDYQGPQVVNYNFVQIVGGFYKPHVSPHLKGAVPTGGNLAFKDGHVAWRKFEQMNQRAQTAVGFWW